MHHTFLSRTFLEAAAARGYRLFCSVKWPGRRVLNRRELNPASGLPDQAKRAAELIALAQQKRALEVRPLKRRRRQVLKAYAGPPSHVLLGARISVYWPDDRAFYKVCARLSTLAPAAHMLDPE